MPFKIVQTIENIIPKLFIVPTLWETKGCVRWPPKNVKNASKLIKDGDSKPGLEWHSFKCTLKRNYIPTYEEPNKELGEMQLNTDTDYDNDNNSMSRTFIPDRASDIMDFDAMAHDLTENLQQSADNSRTLTANLFCQQKDTVQVFNSEDIQTVIANQTTILQSLNVVMENQKKNAHELASLSIQLEETKASISQEKKRPVNVTLLQDQLDSAENERFMIRPIENQQQMEILENNLADKSYKKKLFNTLSLLCSSSVGSGRTCAYKLLDTLFKSGFLCECSWSGGSKGEMSKIPFKNFKNFKKNFFEIVNTWDSTFTDDDAEKFLKLNLRNATKRKAMKGLRKSSKRTRKNKKVANGGIQKKNDTKEPEADEDNRKEACDEKTV